MRAWLMPKRTHEQRNWDYGQISTRSTLGLSEEGTRAEAGVGRTDRGSQRQRLAGSPGDQPAQNCAHLRRTTSDGASTLASRLSAQVRFSIVSDVMFR